MLQRLRNAFHKAPRAERVDLSGRHVIVTGASPGSLGFETALRLADWGAKVTVTTRHDPERAANKLREQLGGRGDIKWHVMDLVDARSVAQFAEDYLAHNDRLDVLVNNAGVHLDLMNDWKVPPLVDGHEVHWRTNYLGTMQLTHTLLPLLQQTAQRHGEARVVNVVSMLYVRGRNDTLFVPPERYNSWVAYGNSKLGLVHATTELQRRYGPKLQAYCLHPGAVLTNIADKGLVGHSVLGRMRSALRPIEAFFLMTPEEGAQTTIHCATQPGLTGGGYYRNLQPAQTNAQAGDTHVAARLWDETVAWTKAWKSRHPVHAV